MYQKPTAKVINPARVFGVQLILLLLGFHAVTAQTPSPPPTPAGDVVRISTNLIQLDVSVTDKKGNVITDLRSDEVEIYENGEKQKITNFSFVAAGRPVAEKALPQSKEVVPRPPIVLRAEQIRRTMALVVDDLSLSFESSYQTRRALKKFVDEQMQDGDLIAIVRTGAGIGALQAFTSDKRLLYAAIEKIKWNPMGSGGISAFAPIEPNPMELARLAGDPTASDEAIADEQARLDAFNAFRDNVLATGTFGGIKFVIDGMSELPGRKSVILFSDGFRLLETDRQGFQSSGRVMDALSLLIDLATRASVVIYTIDPRGLQYTGFTAADRITDTRPEALEREGNRRRTELDETQNGLRYLAAETGGFAIINTNDLGAGVKRVLEDQSYYLVGYAPDTDTFDAEKRKFNKLEIKVLRKDATVRHRSGFFNVADRQTASALKPWVAMTPLAQLEKALVSPFAVGGLTLKMNAIFGSVGENSSFVRSLLHINARDLKFTDEKDGRKKAVFDVLAASFGDNGQLIDQLGKTYTITVGPAVYKRALTEGIVYHFKFPINKAGAYQFRVAIRDPQGDRIGSASQFVDVPDLAKNRLTLSSIIIENLTAEAYDKSSIPGSAPSATDPMLDTALRQAKLGSVIRYALEIYNAKLNEQKQPNLKTKIRVFRDGKMILDGKEKPFDLLGQTDMQHLRTFGAISIGQQMDPGDYVLQVIVIDTLAKQKQQIATQFVQFEVIG